MSTSSGRAQYVVLTKSVLNQLVTELITGHPLPVLEVCVSREVHPNESHGALRTQKGFAEVFIEHDTGAHAKSLNRKCENACVKLASREHLFSKKISTMRKVLPAVLAKRVVRIESHISEGKARS